jgi:cysteinyl-tRNA synthetase
MTVYYFAHIGHLRTYTSTDVLRRFLESCGYQVRHVMNVTDVGHMTSDADEGEDKLEVRAQREGRSPWEIARYYEQHFFESIKQINIKHPQVICRATEHVPDMIELAKRLEERGFAYRTKVGLIFDTGKFPKYPDLARLNLEGQAAGARVEVDPERHNPSDFALWISNQPKHIMQWDSPWGRGFPGWHLECSAMAIKYLGPQIDLHSGGIDHIPVHHTNEIAQSEAATGCTFVRHWFHSAFLMVDNTKMSKSLGNLYTLEDVVNRGFHPLSLRYLYLGCSYRKTLNFTWEGLAGEQKALGRLWQRCVAQPEPAAEPDANAVAAFRGALAEDLNSAKALSVLWEVADRDPGPQTAATLRVMDEVLGLDFAQAKERLGDLEVIQSRRHLDKREEAERLTAERLRLRKEKKYAEADVIRQQIRDLGFVVQDGPTGSKLQPLGPETS